MTDPRYTRKPWTPDEEHRVLTRAIELLRANTDLPVGEAIMKAQNVLPKAKHRADIRVGDNKWIEIPRDVLESRTGKAKMGVGVMLTKLNRMANAKPMPIPEADLAAALPPLGEIIHAGNEGDSHVRWTKSEQRFVARHDQHRANRDGTAGDRGAGEFFVEITLEPNGLGEDQASS